MTAEHAQKTEKIGNVTLYDLRGGGGDLYSDGEAVENQILDIVRNRTGWDYCLDEYQSWPVLYHLTRQRENIALPMDLKPTDSVLELGAGMGAVTGAFARKVRRTDCVELSMKRSLVNAYRHKDLNDITIYVGNFEDIELPQNDYDVVTLIGVLEYAASYIHSEHPYQDLLGRALKCLKPGGLLYVAIENRLGMKYFAGYHEDHLGRPYAGIEGYGPGSPVRTFSRAELSALLQEVGFSGLEFYYPFPDYKLPTVIYTDETLLSMPVDYKEPCNYDLDVVRTFSPSKAFQSLRGPEAALFANSFLVRAVKGGR